MKEKEIAIEKVIYWQVYKKTEQYIIKNCKKRLKHVGIANRGNWYSR